MSKKLVKKGSVKNIPVAEMVRMAMEDEDYASLSVTDAARAISQDYGYNFHTVKSAITRMPKVKSTVSVATGLGVSTRRLVVPTNNNDEALSGYVSGAMTPVNDVKDDNNEFEIVEDLLSINGDTGELTFLDATYSQDDIITLLNNKSHIIKEIKAYNFKRAMNILGVKSKKGLNKYIKSITKR